MPVIRIQRSRRKTLGIRISSSEEVVVSAPLNMPDREIRRILEEKRDWIGTHLEKIARREAEVRSQPAITARELNALADEAMKSIPPRVAQRAAQLGVRYGRITIRNQRTRWGSCSSQGNLNFNCMLMLCPEPVIDYIVVHEVCHLREMNHSPRFKALVGSILPDWQEAEKWLRKNGPAILGRLRSE